MTDVFGGFTIAIGMFLFVLAILWFILPFAIFGTKGILRASLAEQRKQTKLLEILVAQKTGRVDVQVTEGKTRIEPKR